MDNYYFEQAKDFPEEKNFSTYNLKILLHFLNFLPSYLSGGKYLYFKKIIHKTLKILSSTPENEIIICLQKTLKNNKIELPKKIEFFEDGLVYPLMLYFVVRNLKPKIVVETGVHSGRSTTFILQSLHDNNRGKLYSIDLGYDVSYDSEAGLQSHFLPSEIKTGWLIPKTLKKNWELILGDSKKELPLLLEKLGKIDLFSHDGEHTDSNMTFEYNLAIKYLRQGGVLMSDDVLFSQNGPKQGYLHQVPHYTAWLNFSKNLEAHIINHKVGYLTNLENGCHL